MTDRELLVEVVGESPWRDHGGMNVCGFCEAAWEHRDDCWWVRARAHVESPDVLRVQGEPVDRLPVVARDLAGALVNALAYLSEGRTRSQCLAAYEAFEHLHQADWSRFHPEVV